MNGDPITVVLVDDQDLVRTGLKTLLGADGDIRVVGEAADGRRGVEAVLHHRPDLVLMDIRMPVMDGIEATRRILAQRPPLDSKVIILTTFDDDADVIDAIRAGAVGYLLKDASGADLRDAARRVSAGQRSVSPGIVTKLFDLVGNGTAARPDPRLGDLTERETAVLARVGLGETNNEIAAALSLSPATVRTYVSRILGKLGARDRTELAILALRSGLTP